MAARNRISWYGVACDADGAPQLAGLRAVAGETADLYYYRALGWCKRYCKRGQLAEWWPALAVSVRWPGRWEELRDLWRRHHVVVGTLDEIFDWDGVNGWLIRRLEAAAKHVADKRRAGRKSGKVRRKQKAEQQRDSRKVGWLVGGGGS
jgi:hypothetical protein